jgi:hypothetical protein
MHGEMREAGNPEGKNPFARPLCRWKGNIKIGPKEVGCACLDWIYVAQIRLQ